MSKFTMPVEEVSVSAENLFPPTHIGIEEAGSI